MSARHDHPDGGTWDPTCAACRALPKQFKAPTERELELARCALHLLAALRAARMLGVPRPSSAQLFGPLVSLVRLAAGIESVPELVLSEELAPGRVPVLDLYARLRDELLS